jgi:hypothetical protein
MLRALVTLLLASLVILAASFSPATGSPRIDRVECDRPRTLRLHRFEDGSARLECAGRILVRIGVPH